MNLFQRVAAGLAVACLSAACTTTGAEPTGCATGQIACGTTCVNFTSDLANCGSCGNVCPVPAGGSAACTLGQCQVVCGAGQITCGSSGADAGQALTCATLDTDRANCGGCGSACGSTEVCSDGNCAPCPVVQCGNVCVDTQHDSANCGACGTACPGTQACVNGACAAPIVITVLQPAAGGFVSATTNVEVSVNSQFRIRGVTVDGPPVGTQPDGGIIRHSDLQLFTNNEENPSLWAFFMQNVISGPWDGGMIFTATDEVFRPDAGDAPLHQATATASVQILAVPSDASVVPTIAVSAGGTALTFGSFVPLDSQPITLTASWAAAPANITAVAFTSSLQGNIPTVPITGNSASLTIDPTLLGLGNTVVQACAVDAAGDQVSAKLCSPGFNLSIGALPTQRALETRDLDGGHALWFLNGDGGNGGQLLVSAPADVPNLGGPPTAAASDAGYFGGSLHPANTTNSVFAARSDGTGIDRFDCAGGCRTADFISKADGGVTLTGVDAVTSAAVVVADSAGHVLVAPATGGTAFNPDPGGNASFSAGITPVGSGGLLLLLNRNLDSSADLEMVLYHPALGAPVKIGGDISTSANVIATAFPSGEFAVQYQAASATGALSNLLVTGFFDGTKVSQTAPVTVLLQNTSPDFVPARPGILVGTINKDPLNPGLQAFIANPAASTITFPIPVTCPAQVPANASCTGGVDPLATQTRLAISPPNVLVNNQPVMDGLWAPGNFAISDDQQKLLTVTEDLQAGANSYTVWLVDLQTASALQLYATPLLVGGGGGPRLGLGSVALAPHFVHAAPATVGTVPGKAPAASLAAMPVVIWAELLESDPSGAGGGEQGTPPVVRMPYARILYSRYGAGNTTSPVVAVDHLTLFDAFRPDFYVTSAAAGAVFFPGTTATGNALNIYSAPLTGTTSTASLIMDQFSAYRVREDTSRILVVRADGVIYAGALAPSATQRAALKPVLSDALGGQPNPNNGFGGDYTTTMGFTPDGDHAWAYVQIGNDPFDNVTSAILQVVDLRTGARTNYGATSFFLDSGIAPVGFLGGASIAVSIETTSFEQTDNGFSLFAASSSAGTTHQRFQFPGDGFSGFASSVDGTEGFVYSTFISDVIRPKIGIGNVFPEYFASADPALYQGNFLLQVDEPGISASQPATFSPYGMPYTDAWDIFSFTAFRTGGGTPPLAVPATNALIFFKNWGGTPSLPVALSTFVPTAFVMQQTADHTEALMDFNNEVGSAFARRVKLNGLTPPAQPLP